MATSENIQIPHPLRLSRRHRGSGQTGIHPILSASNDQPWHWTCFRPFWSLNPQVRPQGGCQKVLRPLWVLKAIIQEDDIDHLRQLFVGARCTNPALEEWDNAISKLLKKSPLTVNLIDSPIASNAIPLDQIREALSGALTDCFSESQCKAFRVISHLIIDFFQNWVQTNTAFSVTICSICPMETHIQ